MTVQIIPPRSDFLDANGKIRREWYLFLLGLTQAVGGGTFDDLSVEAAFTADNTSQVADLQWQIDHLDLEESPFYQGNSDIAAVSGRVTAVEVQNAFANGGSGVTYVGETFTGGLISVAGSPITSSGTFALTVAGTSGGIPYFSSGTTWATSAALVATGVVIGGGAGAAPFTDTDLTWDSTNNALTVNTVRISAAGTNNTFVGSGAGNFTTSGTGDNTGVGKTALKSLTTGYFNAALGFEALFSLQGGQGNMAIGVDALYSCVGGSNNVGIGTSSLYSLVSTNLNTAIGTNTLANNVSGTGNLALGYGAGQGSTGDHETFVGTQAGGNLNALSGENVGIGYQAGQGTAGVFVYENVWIGAFAGQGNNGGVRNTLIGGYTGSTLTTGSHNVLIGNRADVSLTGSAYRIVIGDAASGDTDNQAFIGNSSVTAWVPGATNVASLGRSDRVFTTVYTNALQGLAGVTMMKFAAAHG